MKQQQQQQQQQQWRRRRHGSSSGQLPFVISGWLLCFVSVAECVCYFCVCASSLSLRGFGLGIKVGACRPIVWTAGARMGGARVGDRGDDKQGCQNRAVIGARVGDRGDATLPPR